MPKKTPEFYSNFGSIRSRNMFYIDKTSIIKYVQFGRVLLIIRQRRCGKSLAISTIDCYFNIIYSEEDRRRWFDGTEIADLEEMIDEDGNKLKDLRGKLPVLKMDLSELTVHNESFAESFHLMVDDALDVYKTVINLKR